MHCGVPLPRGVLRLRDLLVFGFFHPQVIFSIGRGAPQTSLRFRMLVVLQDLVRNVPPHFGIHGHLS